MIIIIALLVMENGAVRKDHYIKMLISMLVNVKSVYSLSNNGADNTCPSFRVRIVQLIH